MLGTPTVIVENGLSAGLTLQLGVDSVNLVGRAPDAALSLAADEVSVSRRHCMLDVASGAVTVKNLVDADRTRINGQPVDGTAPMRPGDRLEIGSVVLRLLSAPSAATHDGVEDLNLSLSDVEDVSGVAAHLGPELSRFGRGETVVAAPDHESDVAGVPRITGCDVCGQGDPGLVDPDYAASPWLCATCAATRRHVDGPKNVRVGPYEIFQKLGEGGMGTVYEGIDVKVAVRVAVKVLRPDRKPSAKDVQRFVREQGIALTLRHPNIVRCFQVGAQNGLFFLGSELVAGGEATAMVGRTSAAEILHVGVDLFRALAYAHSQGVVHRDVKPANLLVTNPGPTGVRRAKLMDFGLAKNVKDMNNRMLTGQGEAGGTLSMMSPEQLVNFAGASWPSDLYSGAATVYRLLTGTDAIVLAQGEPTFAQIAAGVMSPARRPLQSLRPDLPAALCVYLDGIVARDEAIRWQLNATIVADFLDEWAARLTSASG